ncbi:MAG: hypothetical protein M0041_04040 [Nitrospiraceae bacterium]|nr:hypothetical protein [Nitrospiraceae bacterium]
MILSEIASLVGGHLTGPESAFDKQILGVRSMLEAGPQDLTFLANPKYRGELSKIQAGAILLSEPSPGLSIPQIVVPDPYLALARVMQVFLPFALSPAGSPSPGPHIRECFY